MSNSRSAIWPKLKESMSASYNTYSTSTHATKCTKKEYYPKDDQSDTGTE